MNLFKEIEKRQANQFKTCFQCGELKSRKSFARKSRICNYCVSKDYPDTRDTRKRGIFFTLRQIIPTARLNSSEHSLASDILTLDGIKINVGSSAQVPCWDFKINLKRRSEVIFLICFNHDKLIPVRVFIIPFWKFELGVLPHRLRICRQHFEKFNQFDVRFNYEELKALNNFSEVPMLIGQVKEGIFF